MIKIIFGDEPYLISVIKKETFSMVSEKDFNLSMHEVFDEEVFALCNTFPIMEEKRVVFVDLDKLSLLNNEYFAAYQKEPAEFTELLILCRQVDKNTKFAKELKKNGLLLEVTKLKEETQLKKFIQSFVKEKGGSIESEVLKELVARVNYFDNDATNLISVTNDLEAMLSINKYISLSMVKDMVKDMATENVFSLAKLIEKGDAKGLKKEISLLSPDKAIPTLSLLLREYRIAYKAKFASYGEIGIKFCTFSKMPVEQLVHGMSVCTSIVEDIKNGKVQENIALQLAVAMLVDGKGGNA